MIEILRKIIDCKIAGKQFKLPTSVKREDLLTIMEFDQYQKFEFYEKENKNHRITFSPTEKRFTIKFVPGTTAEEKDQIINVALAKFPKIEDRTRRFNIKPGTLICRDDK